MSAPETKALTPSRIVTRLNDRVVGQCIAKQKLAGALWWNHHRRLLITNGIEPHTIPPKQNALLAGPSGTGKTLMVKTAAEVMGVPWFATPATSYSRVGYVGLNPDDMIAGLLQAANGDVAACERGIIFLDEVDKLRKRDFGGQDDVGGDAVQQMLLTLLDGISVQVKKPGSEDKVRVDTSGITFIAAGAFNGLEDVVMRRLHRSNDILNAHLDEEAYRNIAADDLIDFGLIPEFVARFSVRAGLVPLNREQLAYLLRDFHTSPLRQTVNLFRLHGVELVVEESAIEHLLELALAQQTGTRALLEVMNDRLMHVINALPDILDEGVSRVIVDERCLTRGCAPWKIPGELDAQALKIEELAKLEASTVVNIPVGISNTKGWSDERLKERLVLVKDSLGWQATTGSARKWWDAFERENTHRLGIVVRLAEELAVRKATITEFFLAYVYSNTDNIQANLHYLDYTRLKKEEERKKKEQAAKAAAQHSTRYRTGDPCPNGVEGSFQFDGYIDGSAEPKPTHSKITLQPSQLFPAGDKAKPCWWKRAVRDQRVQTEE